MKASKAPEKIYIQKRDSYNNILEYDSEWTPIPLINKDNIEYTRTDAFIEKATKWLKNNVTYTHPRKGTEECVVNLNAFIEAMKGE